MALDQLLWLEIILKSTAGLTLVIAPAPAIFLAGMPPAASQQWPRLLGGVLIGIASAVFIGLKFPTSGGLGVAGLIAINLAGSAVMAGHLLWGNAAANRRGRLFVLANAALLGVLAFTEIAFL